MSELWIIGILVVVLVVVVIAFPMIVLYLCERIKIQSSRIESYLKREVQLEERIYNSERLNTSLRTDLDCCNDELEQFKSYFMKRGGWSCSETNSMDDLVVQGAESGRSSSSKSNDNNKPKKAK